MSMSEKDFVREGNSSSVEELLDELNKMAGLNSVKEEVSKLVNKIIVDREAGKTFMGPLHMVFKGGSGTDKTAVARIIGEIYTLLGVLPGNQRGVIECTPQELLGQYVGESTQKTQTRIDEAMGGVLVIEEAYSLTQNPFGRECLNTLLIAMEEHRDDLVIIFTGSAKEMDELLDYNMGLSSRIRKELVFEDYRKEDFESVSESYQIRDNHLDELLEEFNNMEGHDELKAVVNRTVYRVLAYRKMGYDVELDIGRLHMVFAGAPGTGKSTMARMVGAIYKELGILPRGNELCECAGNDLLGSAIGDAANLVKDKIKHSMGGILFVDEAYQLSNNGNPYGQEACDTFIKELEDKRDKFMLILAGYTKEMEDFMDTNLGFRSRIPHIIHFEDYSVDQMVSIFKKMAAEKEYTLEEGADEVIRKVLEKKSTGKDFGNARGVRNVLCEVIENLVFRIANEDVPAEEFTIIRKVDMEKVIETTDNDAEEKDVDAILAELDSMVGLGSVKEAVHKIVEMAQYNKWAQGKGYEEEGFGSMHMLFKGNAGTGKTTVARMIGQIYKQLGVLRSGQLVECGRDSLVAGYVGQTAEKTQTVINSAMGGILFVDEAYTLVGKGENDFGNEALTTIMKAMEDHRDDLMVIFAGYSKEIDELIATNQGLESRFSKQNEIVFEDYTPDELLQIFLFQAKGKGMIVEEELYPFIQEVIGKAQAEVASFGNARGVRNIVDSVNGFRKQRIQGLIRSGQNPDAQTAKTITKEDLEKV